MDRFPRKDVFIQYLPEAVKLKLTLPDYNKNQYVFNNDVEVQNQVTLLHPEVIFTCLQGFTNIGIDKAYRVSFKFKMLGCLYNSKNDIPIQFPTPIFLTTYILWFFYNAIQLCGDTYYLDWCQEFTQKRIKSGRKKLNVLIETNENKVKWLLNEEQEQLLLNSKNYLRTYFNNDAYVFLRKFFSAFSQHNCLNFINANWDKCYSTAYNEKEELSDSIDEDGYTCEVLPDDFPQFCSILDKLDNIHFHEFSSWFDTLYIKVNNELKLTV
jgi:hypothetical protein